MRTGFVLAGILSVAFGVIILLLSAVPVPYTSTALTDVPKSLTILNDSFTVQQGWSSSRATTFSSGRALRITFTVTGGGGDIDFWVMDEDEYSHFSAGDGFHYYSYVSRENVGSFSIEWLPPQNQKIYFVWDNSFGVDGSRQVSAYFYETWTESQSQSTTKNGTLLSVETAAPLFLLFFIVGVISTGYGFASKPTSERQLSPSPSTSPVPTPPSVNVTWEKGKFCRYCGAENKVEADFCQKCGKKIG